MSVPSQDTGGSVHLKSLLCHLFSTGPHPTPSPHLKSSCSPVMPQPSSLRLPRLTVIGRSDRGRDGSLAPQSLSHVESATVTSPVPPTPPHTHTLPLQLAQKETGCVWPLVVPFESLWLCGGNVNEWEPGNTSHDAVESACVGVVTSMTDAYARTLTAHCPPEN